MKVSVLAVERTLVAIDQENRAVLHRPQNASSGDATLIVPVDPRRLAEIKAIMDR